MKYLLPLLSFFLIVSCATNYSIKGEYQEGPYIVSTSKSFEETWESVIDLFALEGYPVAVLDKQSGLIATSTMDFTSVTSYEKKGAIQDMTAYIISEVTSTGVIMLYPQDVSGQWNVRIKETGSKTTVSINIVNLKSVAYDGNNRMIRYKAKSTGTFERKIAEFLTAHTSTLDVTSKEPLVVRPSTANDISDSASSDQGDEVNQSNDLNLIQIDNERIVDLENQVKELKESNEAYRSIFDKENEILKERINRLEVLANDLVAQQRNIETDQIALESKINNQSVPQPAAASPPPSTTALKTPPAKQLSPSAKSKPFRTIQFIATGPGNTFSELSHLGRIVSEKVPGKDIFRYKVVGNFDDADVKQVIAELGRLGYRGAFEN